MNKRRLLLLAGLALVVLAGGGAYAAIPDETGAFHACMKKTFGDDGTPRGKGELRIIDHVAGEECNANSETHVHFNERGQTGLQGPPGVDGAPGPQGPPGADGAPGSAGTGAGVTPFTATIEQTDSAEGVLVRTLPNGAEIRGFCGQSSGAGVRVTGSSADFFVFGFGTAFHFPPAFEDPQFPFRSAKAVWSDPFVSQGGLGVDLGTHGAGAVGLSIVVAKVLFVDDGNDETSDPIAYGPFVRVEVMGRESVGETCRFDGLVTPLT